MSDTARQPGMKVTVNWSDAPPQQAVFRRMDGQRVIVFINGGEIAVDHRIVDWGT